MNVSNTSDCTRLRQACCSQAIESIPLCALIVRLPPFGATQLGPQLFELFEQIQRQGCTGDRSFFMTDHTPRRTRGLNLSALGLANLLESRLRVLLLADVRMVPARQLAIGTLDLSQGGVAFDANDL